MGYPTITLGDDRPEDDGDFIFDGPPGFELLDELGRGGMGVVWRARDVALGREVAVKVLGEKYPPGSPTARRFLDEARITGQLQHPGVPAVYQVGALPGGRPFLAMKLIKGDTLETPLKSGDLADPLGVFAAVAQAVGYAHAHGVIHRDLKPQNVMVGAFGEVQVLDWGLAKVLGRHPSPDRPGGDPGATADSPTTIRSSRESDAFTEYGSILGTPAYMAPEQAAGEIDRIDARSDVFGLGAILCVLLTGKPPFEGTTADNVRLNAVRGRTEAALARLDACGADPGVVALCKRCLAIDPADRPASGDVVAGEMASLRRAAEDRVRRAERDRHAAEVRAAEQLKRRQALVRAGGLMAAVLLLGLAGTTAGLIRANSAACEAEVAHAAEADHRREAEVAKVEAQAKAIESDAVVKFFKDAVFAAARPKGQAGGLGAGVTLREAIVASLPALQTNFHAQPLVEARLRWTLGDTFFYLGNYQQAHGQYDRMAELLTRHRGPGHPDTLMARHNLASSEFFLGRHGEAVRLGEEVLAARKRVLPEDDPDTLWTMHNLANDYHALNRGADALRLREQVLAGRRRVLSEDHPDTLWGMHNLAISYLAAGRHEAGLKLYEAALATRRRVMPPDHPDTLLNCTDLAIGYRRLGRESDALPLLQESFAKMLTCLPADHHFTRIAAWHLAECQIALDDTAAATATIDRYLDPTRATASGVVAMLGLRARIAATAADPAGCRASAEAGERLAPTNPDDLYDAACLRAVTAAVQAKSPAVDAANLARADADRAMRWLTQAVAAGYRNRAHVQSDPDLDHLRTRPDFQRLVATLPEVAPPPRMAAAR